MADTAPTAGPYSSTQVKTIEITAPIKITFTTKFDSSHVPPSPEARADEGSIVEKVVDALRPFVEAVIAKLDDIQRSQNPS